MEEQAKSAKPVKQRKAQLLIWQIRLIRYAVHKIRQHRAKQGNESPVDRAVRQTAVATIFIALFTAALWWVGLKQYQEVIASSDAVDRMNRIYRDQNAQLARQASETDNLAQRTKTLADGMNDEADNTRRVADQTAKEAEAALETAKVAQQELEASERPWLSAELSSMEGLTFDENGAEITYFVDTRNVGHSPAISINVYTKLINGMSIGGKDLADRQGICDPWPKAAEWGEAVFPGQERLNGITSTIPAGELKKSQMFLGPAKGHLNLYLVGCVSYLGTLSDEPYKTTFAYSLINGPPGSKAQFNWGEPVPGDKIRVLRLPIGNTAK